MCRTVDRLAAVCRGPEVPATAEFYVLQKLRAWIGELQDLGEVSRGVAPNPIQACKGAEEAPEGAAPAPGLVAATSKAAPALPRSPSVPGTGSAQPPLQADGLSSEGVSSGVPPGSLAGC